MNLNFRIAVGLLSIALHSTAQKHPTLRLSIGDAPPAIKTRAWIKGQPFQKFESGYVYIVEFWATWCRPCMASMPHLSDLARKYRDSVRVIAISGDELKKTSVKQVKSFVDSVGDRMDFNVALADHNYEMTYWFEPAREQSIPKTFVINRNGKLAWIGHPSKLETVLPDIVSNSWNCNEKRAERESNKYLEALDDSLNYELMRFYPDPTKTNDIARPDSALIAIDQFVTREPKLKFAPFIAYHTFRNLLKTDPQKAFEYGKQAIVTSTYTDPTYEVIADCIQYYSDKMQIPPKIYLLGAEAYEMEIKRIPYPELVNIPKLYSEMAELLWRGGQKTGAMNTLQVAIDDLKSRKDYSVTELAALQYRLHQLQNDTTAIL